MAEYKRGFCVSCCVYGGMEPRTVWSVIKSFMSGLNFYFPMRPDDALIGRSRSIEASQFLKHNLAPFLVFLDADIAFEPWQLEKLVEDMKQGYELVGGLYVVKDGSQLAQYGLGEKGNFPCDNEIHEVKYISTGFFGVSRWLLEQVQEGLNLPLCHPGEWDECYPFFESGLYIDPDIGPIYISEDWDFCNKARKVGAKVYADTSIRVRHVNKKEFTVEELLEALTQEPSSLKINKEKVN